MVKMIEARSVEKGMKFSPDGGEITTIAYNAFDNAYTITEICHGVEKKATFNANTRLPIFYDDTNSGED